jgi:3-deoxy-manno-octulosonate cytidylyltransferase (CMP-KDO synthetase)
MTPIVLIPSRMAATRLPGKPLADIGGVAMIVRVLRCAELAGVGPVVVAAGDSQIVSAVEAAGGHAVLTDPELPSGSDRILAALAAVDPDARHDVVINLQGDMPFVTVDLFKEPLALLAAHPACDIATVVAPAVAQRDLDNPHLPKAVLAMREDGRAGRALYFTRSTLYGDGPAWGHYGLYVYRREALARFCAAPPSPLERREKLEQLRALEMGLTVWASVTDAAPISVDTPGDLEAARAFARSLSGSFQ